MRTTLALKTVQCSAETRTGGGEQLILDLIMKRHTGIITRFYTLKAITLIAGKHR